MPGEGRRLVSFAMVMDALAQAWNGKGAVMTVTVEMWKNSPMRVGLGVGDGELHLCSGGRSTWNVGVMFIESAAKTRKRQEVGTKVSVHCIRIRFQ